MHPPGASELCEEWMERWVTGTRKGMLRDISSLGTTKEELEVDGSRTGWLSFACRCNDVANAREKTSFTVCKKDWRLSLTTKP